jgi:hypothetical protein
MENHQEPGRIEIGEETLKNLNTLRKWTMFLSISGFIFQGIIIIIGLITGTFFTVFNYGNKTLGVPDGLVFAVLAGVALINFFPVLFLFRFSKHTSLAISTVDSGEMNIAVKYLKRYFVFIGVLLIAVISIYIVSIILEGSSIVLLKGLQ